MYCETLKLYPMDPHRLYRDELEYELRVRGMLETKSETVASMRAILKQMLTKDKFGVLTTHESFSFNFDDEINCCNKKVNELLEYVQSIETVPNANEQRTIEAKLSHLYGRLNRMSEDELKTGAGSKQQVSVDQLLKVLNDIEYDLDKRTERLFIASAKVKENESSSSRQEYTNQTETNKAMLHVIKQPVPIYQWGIYFNGSCKGLSVNAFIERVEELMLARGVSEDEMLVSIIDLLQGSALSWYRSVRSKITCWQHFIELFKNEYQPYDYENELWKEIRGRMQGSSENVSNYFAIMKNLFARLPRQPSEYEKLLVLRKNILPYYIHALGLTTVDHVDELADLCKRLEISRQWAERSSSVRPKVSFIEPDLAYQESKGSSLYKNERDNCHKLAAVGKDNRCWNCNQEGHRFSQCRKKRNKKFCFTCGKKDVTKFTCDNCSGNGKVDCRNTGRQSLK